MANDGSLPPKLFKAAGDKPLLLYLILFWLELYLHLYLRILACFC